MLRRANGGFFLALAAALVGLGATGCGSGSPPSNLKYSDPSPVYQVNTAITPDTPTSSGGAVNGYTVAPALPAGLSLDPSTGVISGTPTAPGVTTCVVTAANGNGSDTVSLTLTVNNVAPSGLTYSSNPAVYTVGKAITPNSPASTGGTISSYSVAPALPPGLHLDAAAGAISGTPSAITATASYVVTATNSLGSTQASVSITVNDALPIITYSPNPAAYTVGVTITPNVPSNGGGAVTSYAVSPSLPVGLNFDTTTGAISGKPTAITASAVYTVTASNSGGMDPVGVTIAVDAVAPSGLTYSLNPASYTINVAVANNTPTISGGVVVAYTVAPALPAGLALNATTGVISGTPTAVAATQNYTFTATNSGGSATDSVSITVKDVPPAALAYPVNPATYVKGTAIAPNTPTHTGGTVISYAVAPPLPAGLSLGLTTGTISGTPTAVAATTAYVVTATNSGGSTPASVTITVKDIPPTNLVYAVNPATYVKGVAITPNVPSNGGGTIVVYTVSPALPAGLALNPATGVISGTATVLAALTTYTVTGTNTGGATNVGVSIVVNDTPPTNLVYSSNPAVYTKGTAIPTNTPSNTGGAIITYSVSPPLPAGLAISAGTGLITGTPTAITTVATYTVTGTNAVGSTTVGVLITVHDAAPANLSYSLNPAVYTKGVAIASNVPTSSGGAVVSYSVAPPLPAGLALSLTTGVISGTPTAITAVGTYTVTATNLGGSATAAVSITVNDVAPTGLSYAVNPATYTKGTAIATNTASTSGGGPVVSYAVNPALPAGLALNTSSGAITGTPTAVTAASNFTVTATNTGGSTPVVLNITVKDIPPSNLVYSTNPAVYVKGLAITQNSASAGGGAVVSYGVAPPLPVGLALNTGTGAITGTPTVVTPASNFTVTATNSGGSATVVLNITVNDVAPTNLVYLLNPAVYTKGTAIASNTPSNGGGVPVSYAVAPLLPAGLALNTATGVITGTPTVVAGVSTFVVTATNTAGSTTANLSITINDAPPTNLLYSPNAPSYTKGLLITPNTPTNAGGAVVSYGVAPTLPAGLAFNTSTGAITGTPTTVMTASNFVVTATNTGGSTTDTLSITIKDVAPSGLTYSSNPAVYTVGTAIPTNVPTSGGGAVVSYGVAPGLPAGLALSTTTGIISGTPTVVTTTATFVVTATNSGGTAGANVSITVNVAQPTRFAFVANETDNTLSSYTLNETTGKLRSNGFAATGTNPRTVAVTPSGKFVYSANIGANTISMFSIGTSGQLTSIGAAVGAGTRPFSVTVDPKSKFVYAANFDSNDISAYTINASTGALTSVGPTAPAGTNPSSVAVDPTGRFLYAANQGGNVSAFSINASSGALTAIGTPIAAGTTPYWLTVDPSARFVYVTNEGSNNVSAYSINASSGSLTAIGSAVGAGTSPVSVAVNPAGTFAYVANTNSNNVSIFSISPTTGALTASTPATAPSPSSVTIDASGDFAYVSNANTNNVTAYSINAGTGALTLIQTIAARAGATSFALAQGTAAVVYTPKFAYVANLGGNNVTAYTVNAGTGALGHIGTTDIATGQGPSSVAVDPLGRFAYVANESDGTVSTYSISSSTGALTQVGTAITTGSTSAGPISVTVDPSASFVYVANNATGDVAGFTITQSTGALTSVGANIAAGSGSFSITVDPTGRFAYVANEGGNSVAAYTINPTSGVLTSVGTNATTGNNPVSVAVDTSGNFLYVANIVDLDIQTFSINPASGALTSVGTTPAQTGATGPIAISVDPTGNFLYVANDGTSNVYAYSINNGVLTAIGLPIASGVAPRSCAVDPSGSFVYAGNSGSAADSVSGYSINASTGALTSLGADTAAGANPNSVAISATIQ